jgi:hypothetical protein
MKNIIFKNINYLYLFSLLVILIFYFFPGDIVSYFMHRNLDTDHDPSQNPIAHAIHFLINTGGYSFNHILTFSYITAGGLLTYFKEKKLYKGIFFFISLSIFLELIHLVIPNRVFELNDLLANIVGVVIIFFLFKFKKKFI